MLLDLAYDIYYGIIHPKRNLDICIQYAFSSNEKKNAKARENISKKCPILSELIENK